MGAFLHYIYKLSEGRFAEDPMAFGSFNPRSGRPSFDSGAYLEWLEDGLSNQLKVMRKVSARGGQARRPFQGELAVLRNFGYVSHYRLGVGLVINWPKVQEDTEGADS